MSARRISLARIAARLEEARLIVTPPAAMPDVTGISDDSRSIASGDLFCAWKGTTSDAHQHVAAVAAAGAAAALVERPVTDAAIPQIVVTDGRRAAALAAACVYADPQNELLLIGVTGTNGKTTTVWILRHLLEGWHRSASLGTLGLRTTGESHSSGESLTTPGPVQLARTLRQLRDDGYDAIAMEVSSHSLDQGRVEALRFDAAIFTNLTRDHLDYHETMEAYRAAKLRLASMTRDGGAVIINADEPAWESIRAPRLLSFSTTRGADVRAERIELAADGARFELVFQGRRADVHLPLLGAYNVENALGAAAACLSLGYSIDEIAARLGTVPQVPGRLERIVSTPCPVLADYAHTPDALERALNTLRPLVHGRLIVVFGAGGDRDRGKRPEMGRVAAQIADLPIVTSDNPRTENPDAIIDEIIGGMGGAAHVRMTDRKAAIAHALQIAHSDDLVLLAGKGHENYQVVGTEKLPFDERIVVHDILHGRAEVRA